MYTIKIQKIGDSLGITLPQEVLEQLDVAEGDNLFVIKTEDGVQITTQEPNFAKAMKAYKKGSEKYKNALRELAQ
jgi:putative addiction module antidote